MNMGGPCVEVSWSMKRHLALMPASAARLGGYEVLCGRYCPRAQSVATEPIINSPYGPPCQACIKVLMKGKAND